MATDNYTEELLGMEKSSVEHGGLKYIGQETEENYEIELNGYVEWVQG